MSKYPIYLELEGKRTVVIGAGAVAARKAQSLCSAGARVIVIAPRIDPAFERLSNKKNIEIIESAYSKDYLAEAVLAIAATNDSKLNQQIFKDCQQLEVLCNVVDVPELCDFYVPAVVKRGDLQIAIGTDGNCPAYAGHIRKKLEDQFTEDHGRFVIQLEIIRKNIISDIKDPNQRKAILGQLVKDESFEYFVENGPQLWIQRAQKIIHSQPQ
jgi:precorrin-2 dehydrogenase/sirohydrochlorin ferrochelatase